MDLVIIAWTDELNAGNIRQRTFVDCEKFLSMFGNFFPFFERCQTEGGRDIRHLIFVTNFPNIVVPSCLLFSFALDSKPPQSPCLCKQAGIPHDQHTPVSSSDVFDRLKR